MNYTQFKNEMKNYSIYLKSKEKLEQDIEILVYEMSGVKGIRFDKERMSFNPDLSNEIRYVLSQKLEEKELELNHINLAIKIIEMHLNKLPKDVQEICDLLFVKDCTYKQVGIIYGYSDNALWHKVRREIEKI